MSARAGRSGSCGDLRQQAIAGHESLAAIIGTRWPRKDKVRALERLPYTWNHVIEKESLNFKELEHILIEKVEQLFRNMLWWRRGPFRRSRSCGMESD